MAGHMLAHRWQVPSRRLHLETRRHQVRLKHKLVGATAELPLKLTDGVELCDVW